jgi:CYTH domain-containing protein
VGRYAQVEREQRWLLRAVPAGVDRPVEIEDRYLGPATRLRLRTMTEGPDVVYKLGQKVRPDESRPSLVKLTNIYLSAAEHELLRSLPGHDLRKTRWRYPAAPRHVVVDEFQGRLAGLVLAETELGPDEPLAGLPGVLTVDVTDDDRFSGGALARLPVERVAGLLRAVAALVER